MGPKAFLVMSILVLDAYFIICGKSPDLRLDSPPIPVFRPPSIMLLVGLPN